MVHFCSALLVSAILSAPWPDLEAVHIPLVLTAAAGLVYMVVIIRRARARGQYQPVLEDWIWHTMLPFTAYAAICGAALKLQNHPTGALFLIGGATLLLVFIGIHNAWDTVVWIATQGPSGTRPRARSSYCGSSAGRLPRAAETARSIAARSWSPAIGLCR